MSRQERQLRDKQREDNLHQRQVRRNQILFAILSVILIVSMLLSLVSF